MGDGEGQGSLTCCSPWGCKELDMTEQQYNLNKEVKNPYSENCEPLIKEIEDAKNWIDSPCSWIGKIDIVKMSMLLKASSLKEPLDKGERRE